MSDANSDKISSDLYTKIKEAACPYCRVHLPEVRYSDTQEYIHSIPFTEHRFKCEANLLRNELAKLVYQNGE